MAGGIEKKTTLIIENDKKNINIHMTKT